LTTSSCARTLLRASLLAFLLTAPAAGAYTLEELSFEDPAQTEAFRELIEQLRCLVCQNESLAASQAELAQDLREEIYRMFKEGKSRDEIIEFLVARYGDFVLYDPPLKPSTYILWFGPFAFVGIGAFFLIRTLLRKQQSPDRELSDEERQRLEKLLARSESGSSEADSPNRLRAGHS
jgi:cytochrome c-type biogenesis protein CcmH